MRQKIIKHVLQSNPETLTYGLQTGYAVMPAMVGFPPSQATKGSKVCYPSGSEPGAEVGAESHTHRISTIGYHATPKGDSGRWIFLDAWNEEIAHYRKMTGKTNQMIADGLGISKFYLQAISYGQKEPGMETILNAAVLFGVSPLRFSNHPALRVLFREPKKLYVLRG